MVSCLVCRKRPQYLEFDHIQTYLTGWSEKTVKTVLQELTVSLKIDLKIPDDSCICLKCRSDLVLYDKIVSKLENLQKRLTRKIVKGLKGFGDQDVCCFAEMVKDDEMDDDQKNDEDAIKNIDNEAFNEEEIDFVDASADEENIYLSSNEVKEKEEIELSHDNIKLPTRPPENLEKKVIKTKNKNCTCRICGVTCKDEEYLDLHMNIHEGKTENECKFCSKRYTRKCNVIRHMHVHWDKKKFQCEKCGLRFSQNTILYNHRLQHEAEEEPLICAICKQSFKTKRTYKGHMMTHREDRPRYCCTYCTKTFVEKYTLKVHIRTHEGNNEKAVNEKTKHNDLKDVEIQHTCIICGLVFNTKETYNQHMENEHDVILVSKT